MKSNIILFGLKYNWIVIFVFKLYLIWSNFYQFIEKTFMKIDNSKVLSFNEYRMINGNMNKTVKTAWNEYCNDYLKLYHWRYDKWYQLGDVISCPERSVIRKGVDCDDYSLLSYYFIPDFVNENGDVYEYESLKSIYWDNGRGHSIAVWKNTRKNKYFVVSNDEIIYTDNYINYFERWVFEDEKTHKIIKVINYDVNNGGKLKFKGIS